nr:MAG TPA: hypothetical protein [Caudoviricetes sp.]
MVLPYLRTTHSLTPFPPKKSIKYRQSNRVLLPIFNRYKK